MSNSTNQMVLVGRIPVGVKGDKNGPLMDIYVNPNNVTHVKDVIYPIYASRDLAVHNEKPERYIYLGTMIFLTTSNSCVSGNNYYGINPQLNPTSVFTNVKLGYVVEILNGDKLYDDLEESDMYSIPDNDILERMGWQL